MKPSEKLSKDTHQLVTVKQLEEAYNDKNIRKFIFLLELYIRQHPDIEQKVVERLYGSMANYKEIQIGDKVPFFTAKES